MQPLTLLATLKQRLQVLLEDGNTVTLTLRYLSGIRQWSIDIEYKDFVLHGERLCNAYNFLQQYSLILPFGLNVTVSDGREPLLLNDFESGRVQLSLLSATEVQTIRTYYTNFTGKTNE